MKTTKSSFIKAGVIGQLDLKWRCLQAWCLTELQAAEEETQNGKGIKVFEDDKAIQLREVLFEIRDGIKINGNTKEIMTVLDQRNKRVGYYYNSIHKIVDKYFLEGNEWIPSFFVLNVLSEYKMRGHKGFETINFLEVIAEFEKIVNKDLKLNHFKCAIDVIESLDKLKFSIKKKGKRK